MLLSLILFMCCVGAAPRVSLSVMKASTHTHTHTQFVHIHSLTTILIHHEQPPTDTAPHVPGLLLLPNTKVRYSRQTCLVPSASQLQTDEEECKGHHKGVVANIAGSRGQHEVAFTDAETASEVGCDVTDIPLGCRCCDVTSELPSPTLPSQYC